MKYFIIIFAIILLAIAYLSVTELRDINRVQQSTIDGLREQLKNCKQ